MSGTFQGRLAYASCTLVAGPAVTITSQSGDFDETPANPIYSAVGKFELTLSSPIDPTEAAFQVTCRDIAGRPALATIDSALTTATTVFINVFDDAGAAFDPVGFDVSIIVKPAN